VYATLNDIKEGHVDQGRRCEYVDQGGIANMYDNYFMFGAMVLAVAAIVHGQKK